MAKPETRKVLSPLGDRICIHILRATDASYNSKVSESKEAFHLMQEMKEQIENYYLKNKEKIEEVPE